MGRNDVSNVFAQGGEKPALRSHRARNLSVLAVVVIAWLVFDQLVKRFFDSGAYALGEHIAGPILGLFRFTLVHNTGGAWGIFSDSTVILGIVALAVSALLVGYLVWDSKASLGQAFGVALVVAGGIGNAIDRFAQGYVIDFIDLTFMDFPVFNIADIGVTCGIVILLVATLVAWRKEDAR